MRLLCLGENWDTAALSWLLWRKLTCEELVGAWSARSLPQPEKLEWDLAGVMPAKKLSRALFTLQSSVKCCLHVTSLDIFTRLPCV